jgi:hypothetical protein
MVRGVSDPVETEDEVNRRHNEKAARRKAARDRMLATKTEEHGLLIVHTGTGKGKSTAAFGIVLRCLGHGMRVGIVQFVKGVWHTGERTALEHFGDLVTCRAMGEGFTWDTQDRARDIAAARPARHRHRPQRQAEADRGGRSRDRDDARQAPVPRRRQSPAGHRVLTSRIRSDRTINSRVVIASEAKQSRAAERRPVWITSSLRSSQ